MNTNKRTFIYFLLVASFLILSCNLGGAAASKPTLTPIPPTAASLPPTATSVPPTNTPIPPTPTPIPSSPTPIPPTSTSIPSASIPGWAKFEGGGVELWMPESFQGGDLANDLDVIVQRLRALGTQYEQMANMIEQNPSAFVLLIIDSKVGTSGFLTNVNVVKEQVLSTITIQTYLDASTSQLSPLGFTILEQKIVNLDNYEAGRLVVESSALKAKEVMYMIKNDNTVWVITYATGISDFDNLLPTFEQSINTFRVQP